MFEPVLQGGGGQWRQAAYTQATPRVNALGSVFHSEPAGLANLKLEGADLLWLCPGWHEGRPVTPVVYEHRSIYQQPVCARTFQREGVGASFDGREDSREAGRKLLAVHLGQQPVGPFNIGLVDGDGIGGGAGEHKVVEQFHRQARRAIPSREPLQVECRQLAIDRAAQRIVYAHPWASLLADAVQRRHHIVGRDEGAAAADDLRPLGIHADNGNGLDGGRIEWQQCPVVFEQHHRLGSRLTRHLAMFGPV